MTPSDRTTTRAGGWVWDRVWEITYGLVSLVALTLYLTGSSDVMLALGIGAGAMSKASGTKADLRKGGLL